MAKWDDSRVNEKKEALAWNLTAMVHGEAEADKAQAAARALFTGASDAAIIDSTTATIKAQFRLITFIFLRKLFHRNSLLLDIATVGTNHDIEITRFENEIQIVVIELQEVRNDGEGDSL